MNICIIGIPEEERKDLRNYLKRISEDFPNIGKEIVNQVYVVV